MTRIKIATKGDASQKQSRPTGGRLRASLCLVLAIGLLLVWMSQAAQAEPWKFAVIADSQGSGNPDQVNGVAVDVLSQVAKRLATSGVELVIPVGDLTEGYRSLAPTPQKTQEDWFQQWRDAMDPVYKAGIKVMPLRGNHDAWDGNRPNQAQADAAWRGKFPEIPTDQCPKGSEGFTYAFTVHNALFVNLDLYKNMQDRVSYNWLQTTLKNNTQPNVFVLTHENLFDRHRSDLLTPSTTSSRDDFVNLLTGGNVHLVISGHDHEHYHSAIMDSQGNFKLSSIISAPTCRKFFDQSDPSDKQAHPIRLITNRYGYYIYTVDGPKVTVDFYAPNLDCSSGPSSPNYNNFNWTLLDSFTYSSNGREFCVAAKGSYAGLSHSSGKGSNGTTATILGGTNTGDEKLVSIGWTASPPAIDSGALLGETVGIHGMANSVGADKSDAFVLQLSYDPTGLTVEQQKTLIIAGLAANGRWSKTPNFDSQTKAALAFVDEPYNAGGNPLINYPPGTHGVDTKNHVVWAVVDHDGDFSVVRP